MSAAPRPNSAPANRHILFFRSSNAPCNASAKPKKFAPPETTPPSPAGTAASASSSPPASSGKNNSLPSTPKTLRPTNVLAYGLCRAGLLRPAPSISTPRWPSPPRTQHYPLSFRPVGRLFRLPRAQPRGEFGVALRLTHPFCHLDRSGPVFYRRAVFARGATERRDLSSMSA